jgi:aryl-phospho-beta-D-glucosidase BglC (GH1 family)
MAKNWTMAVAAALMAIAIGLGGARAASPQVFKSLAGGVNIEADQLEKLSDADLDYLRDVGVRSVRLFLWPKYGDRWNYLTPGKPMDPDHNPEVARVSKFVARVTKRGLAIILVPFGGPFYQPDQTDASLAMQVGWFEEFADYARRHWKPDKVLIETWNEPQIPTAEAWRKVESALIAAVRRKAPKFTVVATTLNWSAADELVKTQAYMDKNIIYDIHFYAPMEFTHQGMPWMGPYFTGLCHNPYPGTKGFDAEHIRQNLNAAAEWAKRQHAQVVIGEFGAGNLCSTPEDKAAYLQDVRQAAEDLGLGWMVWDFNKAFAIASPDKDGRWRIDPRYLDALNWRGRAR